MNRMISVKGTCLIPVCGKYIGRETTFLVIYVWGLAKPGWERLQSNYVIFLLYMKRIEYLIVELSSISCVQWSYVVALESE